MKYLLALALLVTTPAYAGNWQVDPAQSAIRFETTESGTAFTGQFKGFTADITFDPADLANAKADVTIDTKDATTGSDERDEALNEAAWFAVKQFPAARFTATAFRHIEGNRYEADGTLTIRDVTKPVTLPFTLDIEGDTARMTGELTLTRTDFGVGQGKWATSDDVGKAVKVTVTVTAKRT